MKRPVESKEERGDASLRAEDARAVGAFLQEAFEERRKRNAKYSLRAFARDLGLPASQLTSVLKGDMGISLDRARCIASRLQLPDPRARGFLFLVEAAFSRSPARRAIARARKRQSEESYATLKLDVFELISKWHHLALLSRFQLAADNTARMELFVDGTKELDLEFLASAPADAKSDGIDLKTTKVNVDSEGTAKVGDVAKCLHALDAAQEPDALKLECGEGDTRPATIGEDAQTYRRK